MQCTSVTLEACKIYWMPAVHLLIDDTQKSQYAQVYKMTVQAQLFTKTVKCHQMKENTWLWVACCHCCVQLHVKCMSAILHVVFKYLNEPIIASQQNFFLCVTETNCMTIRRELLSQDKGLLEFWQFMGLNNTFITDCSGCKCWCCLTGLSCMQKLLLFARHKFNFNRRMR